MPPPRKARGCVAPSAPRVLRSRDLVLWIVQFQRGVHLDLHHLRQRLHMPLSFSCEFPYPSEFDRADAFLSPWYYEQGYTRVIRLLRCYPSLTRVVLSHAVYFDLLPLVHLLHSSIGYNLLQRDLARLNLLDIAAFSGALSVFKYLYEAVGHPGLSSKALKWAVRNGRADIVDFVHTHNVMAIDARSLKRAAKWGQLALVQYLCHVVLGPNVDVGDAVVAAAANGHVRVVQYLLQLRPDTCIHLAVLKAAEHNRQRVLDWLATQVCGPCWGLVN